MRQRPRHSPQEPIDLNISADKVCYIVVKARGLGAKVRPHEPDPGSNPSDDGDRIVLEDHADDPTRAELEEAIRNLNDDEVVDLIAMAWLGRGDFSAEELEEARALAAERHRTDSAPYLVGMPLLGDFLEEGLGQLGHSCEETSREHL